MKISLCHHYSLSFGSGGEKILISIANELRARGHKVKIFCLPLKHRVKDPGVQYQEGFFHNIKDVDIAYFIYAPILHHLFRGNVPRIAGIHGFSLVPVLQHLSVTSMNFLRLFKQAGFIPTTAYYYFNKLQKRNLNDFDAVHVINRSAKNLFVHRNVYYVPNWVYTNFFRPCEQKEEKFKILFCGRQNWLKGFDVYVKVASALRHSDIEFLSTGNGMENVKGLGFVEEEDLPKLYSKVHAVISPSRIDVFSVGILEATSCGTPVITSPILSHTAMDLPLIYGDSVNEIVKQVRNLKDMWDNDTGRYYEFCNKFRNSALKYDVKRVFPKFERMLYKVANRIG